MVKIGIYGYGNLGRGVEQAIKMNKDMELVAVFSRRNPSDVKIGTEGVKVYSVDDVDQFIGKVDVMVLCGGSATDLPTQTPALASKFNVIDSFDTHKNIPVHYANVNKEALKGSKTAVISSGWDPGMFSVKRIYMESILPNGVDYTFWGKGVSQGHSDAIRRIEGVVDARQYTIPKEEALEAVRSGKNPTLTVRDKHLRECYVVSANESENARIEKEIKEMPNYFNEYDTIVHFVTLEELKKNHSGLPHGGFVIRSGETSTGVKHRIEYSLDLDSNPEFTGSVLIAYARAIKRLNDRGEYGCKTVFDIAPRDLSIEDYDTLISHIL